MLHNYEFIVCRLKFYKRQYFKSGFIRDMFWSSLISDRSDDCLKSVFVPLHIAIENVHLRFFEYVHD